MTQNIRFVISFNFIALYKNSSSFTTPLKKIVYNFLSWILFCFFLAMQYQCLELFCTKIQINIDHFSGKIQMHFILKVQLVVTYFAGKILR